MKYLQAQNDHYLVWYNRSHWTVFFELHAHTKCMESRLLEHTQHTLSQSLLEQLKLQVWGKQQQRG